MFSVKWLTRTAVLLALTLAIQLLGLPQTFTGPAVNALLLLAGILVNPISGICIGLLTPIIAFTRGILPAPLAPAIPFIMLGNAFFVFISCLPVKKRSYLKFLGVLAGAASKYLILSFAVQSLINLPPAAAKALQLPQLFTAVTGGVVALILAELLLRMQVIESNVTGKQKN